MPRGGLGESVFKVMELRVAFCWSVYYPRFLCYNSYSVLIRSPIFDGIYDLSLNSRKTWFGKKCKIINGDIKILYFNLVGTMSYVYNSAIRYNIKMEFTLGKLGEKWPWKLNKKATKRFYMSFLSI